MKKVMKKRLNQKGLTLIELLAVIVILAIVAAIAVPAIGSIIENSRIKAAKSDAAMILNAANIYDTEDDTNIETAGVTIPTAYLESQGNFSSYTVSENASGVLQISGTWENGKTLTFNNVSLDALDTSSTALDTGMSE